MQVNWKRFIFLQQPVYLHIEFNKNMCVCIVFHLDQDLLKIIDIKSSPTWWRWIMILMTFLCSSYYLGSLLRCHDLDILKDIGTDLKYNISYIIATYSDKKKIGPTFTNMESMIIVLGSNHPSQRKPNTTLTRRKSLPHSITKWWHFPLLHEMKSRIRTGRDVVISARCSWPVLVSCYSSSLVNFWWLTNIGVCATICKNKTR